RIMKEHVWAISLPDKTIPFELVEPFDFANHSASFQRGLSTFAYRLLRPGKYVRSAGEMAACAGNDRRTSSAQPSSNFNTLGLWTSLLRRKKDSYAVHFLLHPHLFAATSTESVV